jgi:hypothetical protein
MSKRRNKALGFLLSLDVFLWGLICGCGIYFLYVGNIAEQDGSYFLQTFELVVRVYHVLVSIFSASFLLTMITLVSVFKNNAINENNNPRTTYHNGYPIINSPILKGCSNRVITIVRLCIFRAGKDSHKAKNNYYDPSNNKKSSHDVMNVSQAEEPCQPKGNDTLFNVIVRGAKNLAGAIHELPLPVVIYFR